MKGCNLGGDMFNFLDNLSSLDRSGVDKGKYLDLHTAAPCSFDDFVAERTGAQYPDTVIHPS